MRNGYLRNISRRSNMPTPSEELDANSHKIVAAVPSRLAKPENRHEITLENAWAHSRLHCNLG
ncbi:MAG: hypothetical protein ABSD73_00850 [Candidatus Bathyarchaeia archaeon]|jgi:hypothetical protein